MATDDLTRSAFYPAKRYSSVRMQQGRVLTDDDFNEARRIDEEDQRRTRVHVIGAAGSPDRGFAVATPTAGAGGVDFVIEAGTFYLGGLRLERPEGETFRLQDDWLQNPGVLAPGGARVDLAYLEAWQQPVSAVEDEELYEVALGGPDTATRHRTMARVRLATGVEGDDCGSAWDHVLAEWAGTGFGTLSPEHELVPEVGLTAGFAPGEADDLCTPAIAGGYLGAENQAIRVALVDADHFTWGFDNGAPLYRARVSEDGVTVTLLSEPRDPQHWPLAGRIVQILPWGAVLENGEKLAEEIAPGHLSRVDSSYDPETGELTLATALPAGFGAAWESRADAADLVESRFGQQGPDDPYFFLRVWDRGDDDASDPAIALAPAPVPLGTTGLTVTIAGPDRRPGDFWIVAARPETPDRVVPWQLEVGRAPHGFRRFVAPLAVVTWAADGTVTVRDCRPGFRPLTEIESCCSVTVGDGSASHGDFTSIQAAIDSLPPSGGKVCVLRGLYEEEVLIANRRDVTIHGCGPASLLVAPEGAAAAALTIRDSRRITVEGLAIFATDQRAIELLSTPPAEAEEAGLDPDEAGNEDVLLDELAVGGRDRAAIAGDGGTRITLRHSRIAVGPLEATIAEDAAVGREPAVFLAGTRLLIEGNEITAAESDASLRTPLGGLQIGGGSSEVEIRRNRIEGGNGTGIALGSYGYVPAQVRSSIDELTGWYRAYRPGPVAGGRLTIGDAGCIHPDPDPQPPKDPETGDPLVPVSDGPLTDVRIVDNEISAMGANGIAVTRFFDLEDDPVLLTTDRLTIEDNRIHGCLRLELLPFPEPLRRRAAWGGIALADGEYLIVRRNTIEDNGRNHLEPICGLFVLFGEGIAVDGNRILRNGPPTEAEGGLDPGRRGGVVVGLALARGEELPPGRIFKRLGDRQDGVPALRVHDNVVVTHAGRALEALAVGPVTVADNQLTAHGSPFRAEDSIPGGIAGGAGVSVKGRAAVAPNPVAAFLGLLGGGVVSLVNLGVSNELYLQLLGLSGLGLLDDLEFDPGDEERASFFGGNLLFHDNQVVFDALRPETSALLSAVLLLSLDDVSAEGNQSDCHLEIDFLATNLLALGWSVRAADNRFKEGFFTALLSAVTVGLFNATTNNQGTHCFWAIGPAALRVVEGNRSLWRWLLPQICSRFEGDIG